MSTLFERKREVLRTRIRTDLETMVAENAPLSQMRTRVQAIAREYAEFVVWAPSVVEQTHLLVLIWSQGALSKDETMVTIPVSSLWCARNISDD